MMKQPSKADISGTLKMYLTLPEAEIPSWQEAFTSGRVKARTAPRSNLRPWYSLEEHKEACGRYKLELGGELPGTRYPMLSRYLEHLRDVRRDAIEAAQPKSLPPGPMVRHRFTAVLSVMLDQMEAESAELRRRHKRHELLRPMNHRDRWAAAGGEGECPAFARAMWFEYWDAINDVRKRRSRAREEDPVAYEKEHGTGRSSTFTGSSGVTRPDPKPQGVQRNTWIAYARQLLRDGVAKQDVARLITSMGIDPSVTKAVVATAARGT